MTRPPGLVTRNNSLAAISGLGANIAPKAEVTTSNRPVANGSTSASASIQTTPRCSASDRARPSSTIRGVRSEAVTDAPRRAANSGHVPGARRDVQKLGPGSGVTRCDERIGRRLQHRGQLAVVAKGPHPPHPLLHLGVRVHGARKYGPVG